MDFSTAVVASLKNPEQLQEEDIAPMPLKKRA